MKRRIRGLSFLLCNALCIGVQAGTTLIVSPPPPLHEVVSIPSGYQTCYTVRPGFYNGIWHYTHRVCEYSVNSGRRMWVSGYWQCVAYKAGGNCTRTTWVGSHWAGHQDIEYTMGARGVRSNTVYSAHDRGSWQPHVLHGHPQGNNAGHGQYHEHSEYHHGHVQSHGHNRQVVRTHEHVVEHGHR